VGVHRLPTTEADVTVAADSTVAVRVAAVLSFYRFHADVHDVPVAARLYRVSGRGGRGRYVRGLAHLDRRRTVASPMVRVRQAGTRPAPILRPAEVTAILDGCAPPDPEKGGWRGSLRDRLLFATLNETGVRLGECLSMRHCDWHVGRGDTPFVEVVPRQDHPAGVRVKNSRYRRIYISDELERLHSEYMWQLCDAGAHRVVDLEQWWVFVNLRRGLWLAPLRPETVYARVASLKRRLGAAVPAAWTPHWFRHTHASALLLAGVREHVVMRRLGHADIQTTLNLYGWVSEDAELRALGDWASWCAGWRGVAEDTRG
jgi:site-specific recombinase XerD